MEFSNEIKVGLQLFDYRKAKIGFSDLIIILDGRLSKNDVSKSIDTLSDLGLVEGEYASVGSRSKRIIFLTKEGEIFFEAIKNTLAHRLSTEKITWE